MAKKNKEKSKLNKAKHYKLVDQKKNKLRKEKRTRKEKLKEIIKKANEQKNS